MCAEKFPLVSMGGRAEDLACADPGARTPIGASRNFSDPSHLCMIIVTNIIIKPHPVTSLGLFNNTGSLLGNIDGKPTQSNIKLDRLLDYLWKEVQILATHIAATKRFIKNR